MVLEYIRTDSINYQKLHTTWIKELKRRRRRIFEQSFG
jgi:hypothetical protein